MSEISVNNISKIFTYEYILEDVTFQVGKGERVGLIGRNGTGKTTLFNIITGREEKSGDLGSVVIRKGAKIGRLDQIPNYPTSTTTAMILHQPFQQLKSMQIELSKLEKRLEIDFEDSELLEEYKQLQHKFDAEGGYEIETKIKWVCLGLKISTDLYEKSFELLSGGEKTRVTLAKILLSEPDVLLLDEPTNHLDMESVEWLENFLQKYTGAALIITHDRYFIDRAINKIIVLENGKVTKFNSNYTNYALELQNRAQAAMNEYSHLKKEISRKQKELRQSIARNAKNHSAFMSVKIRELTADLDNMKQISKPKNTKKMGLKINSISKSSKIVLRMEKVNKSYGQQLVLDQLDFYVEKAEKIAIVGANGCGKSTLIKLMMDQVNRADRFTAESGEVYVGAGIKVGYLDQELEFPNPELNILEELCRALNIKPGPARSILARFLFYTNDIDKQIKIISGGEKTRLKLAILMNEDLNTLVLDEPTNHLDIESRELLEEVLGEFTGSVLIISHDRYFINKSVGKIAFLNNGKMRVFEGSYTKFKKQIELEASQKVEQVSKDNSDYVQSKKERNLQQRRKRQLVECETKMEKLENLLAQKAEEMFDYPSNYQKLQGIQNEQEQIQTEIDELYELWLELQD